MIQLQESSARFRGCLSRGGQHGSQRGSHQSSSSPPWVLSRDLRPPTKQALHPPLRRAVEACDRSPLLGGRPGWPPLAAVARHDPPAHHWMRYEPTGHAGATAGPSPPPPRCDGCYHGFFDAAAGRGQSSLREVPHHRPPPASRDGVGACAWGWTHPPMRGGRWPLGLGLRSQTVLRKQHAGVSQRVGGGDDRPTGKALSSPTSEAGPSAGRLQQRGRSERQSQLPRRWRVVRSLCSANLVPHQESAVAAATVGIGRGG